MHNFQQNTPHNHQLQVLLPTHRIHFSDVLDKVVIEEDSVQTGSNSSAETSIVRKKTQLVQEIMRENERCRRGAKEKKERRSFSHVISSSVLIFQCHPTQ